MPLKKIFSTITILLCFLFCFVYFANAKTYKVSSRQQCEAAIPKLVAGDMIIILNGSYSNWEIIIPASGTATKPIQLKAETNGKVIFSGEINKPAFTVTGNYVTIAGISFNACSQIKNASGNGLLIELKGSSFSRVTDCTFTNNSTKNQFTPMVTISGNGKRNQVDHCKFSGNIDNQELQVKVTENETPLYTLISNNQFSDKPKVSWANSNGGECVQIGQDPVLLGTKESFTTVRNNRFVACNGEPEVISNKSSANKYINNYFENCRGELVMRGGHDCVIDSNTIINGSGGIRVNGTGHIITNNKLSKMNTGIRLMYGMTAGKTEVGFYVAASNCRITGNEIADCATGIYIGDSKNADWNGKFDTKRYPSRTMQDVPPTNNTISGNSITGGGKDIVHNELPE